MIYFLIIFFRIAGDSVPIAGFLSIGLHVVCLDLLVRVVYEFIGSLQFVCSLPLFGLNAAFSWSLF